MKDDGLALVVKIINRIKQKNEVLLEELEKAWKTSFEYRKKTITVEYKEEDGVPGFLFSAEKNKNQFMITYTLNGVVCFHVEWPTADFSRAFNMDEWEDMGEMEKALQFGFEKIMFPDCSNRTFENSQVITYEEMTDGVMPDIDVIKNQFWWFMPKDKSYSYVGDWDDMNPSLDNVYKVFSGVNNGFGDTAPPFIGKFVKEHPCCQTSFGVFYDKVIETEGVEIVENILFVLPLHKLNSSDRTFLKSIVSEVSKAPIKRGGLKQEYLGEFWSRGPNDKPGGSGLWLRERKGKKEVVLTHPENKENVEGFKRFQSSVWDLEYSNKTKEILRL
jgi:hypothetical protein